MQTQNSAHLNCGEGWNCCRVHSAEREQRGIHSLIAIPLARHKGCLSASVNTKKLWQRTRARCSNLLFEYAAQWHQRRRTIIQSAQERDPTSAPHMGKAHPVKSPPLLTSIFSSVRRKCTRRADQHYAFAVNRRRVHLCTMCHFKWRANTGEHRTLLSKQFAIPLLWRSLRLRSNSRT